MAYPPGYQNHKRDHEPQGGHAVDNDTTLLNKLENDMRVPSDELVREGARRMLQAALEAEVADYLRRHQAERDEEGRALVVRNGRLRERTIQCGAGELKIQRRGSMTNGHSRSSATASCRPICAAPRA